MTQPRLLGGRYELDGVIGRGGMAEVYKARDLRLDRIVAIKTLRSDMARDPTFQARFRREAQSAASLNHPSVIAVYDTGEDMMGDTMIPYIVMEYVEGHTLRDLLRENRRLLPEKALEITDGILRALDYSHRGGIVHRDIKPANVMMTRNHEVKVMDFGIARAMADSAATMTQTAQVIGTAQYLSPEQARGERVDARSDLYSTGCVLYELLTGRPPFTGDSPVAIAYQHVREEPVPPSQVDPSIPRWCDAIVLKAMAKDANDRYQSANEFRADVQRAMQGMPVNATASSTMLMGQPGDQRTAMMPQQTRVDPRAAGYPQTQAGQPGGTGYDLPPVDYDEDGRGGGNGRKALLWVAVVAVVIGAAALFGVLLSGGGGNSPSAGSSSSPSASQSADTGQVTIPTDLIGKSKSDAKDELQQLGLQVDTKDESSDTVPKGMVTNTSPGGGQPVDKDSTVTLYISKGKAVQNVQVPDVTNEPYSQAASDLQGQGFQVKQVQASSDTVQQGNVISTDPSAGSSVKKGSTVTVTVSSGSNEVQLPDVTNSTPTAACNQIKALGLRCNVVTVYDPTKQPGVVFQESPSPGTKMSKGETVTLTVATNNPGNGGGSTPPGNGNGNG